MHGKMGPAETKQQASCGRREAVGDGIDLLGTENGNSNSTEEELEVLLTYCQKQRNGYPGSGFAVYKFLYVLCSLLIKCIFLLPI